MLGCEGGDFKCGFMLTLSTLQATVFLQWLDTASSNCKLFFFQQGMYSKLIKVRNSHRIQKLRHFAVTYWFSYYPGKDVLVSTATTPASGRCFLFNQLLFEGEKKWERKLPFASSFSKFPKRLILGQDWSLELKHNKEGLYMGSKKPIPGPSQGLHWWEAKGRSSTLMWHKCLTTVLNVYSQESFKNISQETESSLEKVDSVLTFFSLNFFGGGWGMLGDGCITCGC